MSKVKIKTRKKEIIKGDTILDLRSMERMDIVDGGVNMEWVYTEQFIETDYPHEFCDNVIAFMESDKESIDISEL